MGKRFYLDASALAKRYVAETGTPVINHLFAQVPRREMICLTLGLLEVFSLFVRKRNSHRISLTAFNQAMADFRNEIVDAPDLGKVAAGDSLVGAAIPLVLKHSINATDAACLRSALDIADQLRAIGDDLVLVTSDQRLLKAAQVEGLLIFDPETQSQADLDTLIATS